MCLNSSRQITPTLVVVGILNAIPSGLLFQSLSWVICSYGIPFFLHNVLDGKTGLVSGFQDWKSPGTLTQTWHQTQMTQIYSNPLKYFASPCPEYPCHTVYFPVFYPEFLEGKILFLLLKTLCIRIFWRAPSHKPVTTGVTKLGVTRCLTLSVFFAGTSFAWIVQCRMTHGPQHWENNNW